MGKKQFFCVVDTETTVTDKVVDFAAVIVDRKGQVFNTCAILVRDIWGVDELFHRVDDPGLWSKSNLQKRKDNYSRMVETGTRTIASVNAINRWIEKAVGKYNPTLTAYNLAFDNSKCGNTGIDLTPFNNRFCLWGAAVGNICHTKDYREFALQNHLFNSRTEHGNMTYSTKAESVFGYLHGALVEEPHTALEDAVDFEVPILTHILKKRDWKDKVIPYNWKEFQVRDYYKAV